MFIIKEPVTNFDNVGNVHAPQVTYLCHGKQYGFLGHGPSPAFLSVIAISEKTGCPASSGQESENQIALQSA